MIKLIIKYPEKSTDDNEIQTNVKDDFLLKV